MPHPQRTATQSRSRFRGASPVAALCAALASSACAGWVAPEPALPFTQPAPPGIARGVVFHDLDRDGRCDEGEPALEGVAVSNGHEVVRSDSRGRYELPIEGDDAVIFVIKPTGWATRLSVQRLPRFYYLHKPKGSPASQYPGVPPTGPLPLSVDFGLTPQSEPARFRVIVLADPQPANLQELAAFDRAVVDELLTVDAAFGVTLGDLVSDDLALFEALNDSLSGVGVPWYNALGNHDLNLDAHSDENSDESFERVYGPATYAFAYSGVHFIVIDDVRFLPPEERADPALVFRGEIGERAAGFVGNYLREVPNEALVVLLMHVPLAGPAPHAVEDPSPLLLQLVGRPHHWSLAGHAHTQSHYFLELAGSAGEHHHVVHGAAAGSWWKGAPDALGIPQSTMRDGTPPGYSIATFEGAQYSLRYKVPRRAETHQMRVHIPALVDRAGGSELWVNAFSGSERSQVHMRVGARGGWQPLERVEREDPSYAAQHQRERSERRGDASWRPVPPALPSRHLWRGILPAGLAPGVHRVTVRHIDAFGHEDRALRMLRVD